MQVRMKHEKHGFHIAYTPAEVEHCKKHGWVECVDEPKKDERKVISLKKADK